MNPRNTKQLFKMVTQVLIYSGLLLPVEVHDMHIKRDSSTLIRYITLDNLTLAT